MNLGVKEPSPVLIAIELDDVVANDGISAHLLVDPSISIINKLVPLVQSSSPAIVAPHAGTEIVVHIIVPQRQVRHVRAGVFDASRLNSVGKPSFIVERDFVSL